MHGGRHRAGRVKPAIKPAPPSPEVSKVAGRARTKKAKSYRPQATILYIIAVFACLALGYYVGLRILGNPGGDGREPSVPVASQGLTAGPGSQNADATRSETTGPGSDTTAGAATGGAGEANEGEVLPPLVQGESPAISLPTVGPETPPPETPAAGSSGSTSQLTPQPSSQPSPQPKPATKPAAPPVSSPGSPAPAHQSPEAGAAKSSGLYRVIVGRRDSQEAAASLVEQAKAAQLDIWVTKAGTGSNQVVVQVGAFRSRKNAYAFAEDLRRRGFSEAEVIEPASN